MFGVCVVICDTWHSAISFDLVQGNRLASHGKVLSPGIEGFMAVNVYVYLFPQLLLYFCSYANFRAFLFGAILVHARHRGTTGVLTEARIVYWIVDWVIAVFVGSGCCSGLKEDFIFYIF